MPQNEQTINSLIIPPKPKRPRYRMIANRENKGDDHAKRLKLVAEKFNLIGDIDPGKGQLYIPVNRLNAILRDLDRAGVEPSALICWLDDLINSQMLGHKEHKFINKDGSRSVDSDFFRRAYGKNVQEDYKELRGKGIIKSDEKKGHGRCFRDMYISPETIEEYNKPITKDTVFTIFNYNKIIRRESKIKDRIRHNLANRNNKLFRTGQGNWDAVVRFFEGLDPNLLSNKQHAKYQSDLCILIGIANRKGTIYDEKTGFITYQKKHKITENSARAFCETRDVNISRETRKQFLDLPDIVNLDQPGSHLFIFHYLLGQTRSDFLESYLNDDDAGSFRSKKSHDIGISGSTLKIVLLSVLNGAILTKHGSIYKMILSDGDDDIDLKDYTDQELKQAQTKLDKFLEITDSFIKSVTRWHQDIKENPSKHQTLPKDILQGLSTSATRYQTIASFVLSGYEQQATLWWAEKVQKALMVPLVNFHDGLTLQGKLPDDFLTWGDDVLEIKMIEKPL